MKHFFSQWRDPSAVSRVCAMVKCGIVWHRGGFVNEKIVKTLASVVLFVEICIFIGCLNPVEAFD